MSVFQSTRQQKSVLNPTKNLLSTAVAATLLASSVGTYAQQSESPEVEEVVVTGSYIRRSEGFNMSSPLTQITVEDLEAEGTVNMGQVVQNMTINSGAASAATNSIQGTNSNTSAFNLRGLGTRATLTLVNGKRSPTNNVVNLIPTIAIERLDIVTDGAAALYGSDAVAGVVNYVPFTNYDGLKIEHYEDRDSRGDHHDRQVSALFGTALSSDIDFVAAASYRNMGRLRWIDRPSLMRAGLTSSGTSNPGNFNVPQRDSNGDLLLNADGAPVTARRPDPNCSPTRDDPAQPLANPFGFLSGDRCWFEYGDLQDYLEPSSTAQFFTNLNYEVNADLNMNFELMYSRQVSKGYESSSNPGGRVSELPTIRSELPGNPYRAVAGDGRPLFAQPLRDANGNIVTDAFGKPLPSRNANGMVALADNRFSSIDSDPLGGVPFSEDVFFNAWRPIGKAHPSPFRNTADGATQKSTDDRNWRAAIQLDYSMPFIPNWSGSAFYTISKSIDKDRMIFPLAFSPIAQGLNCDVVNDAGACFNPFAPIDDRFLNSQEIMDQINWQPRRDDEDELQTLDLVLSGTIPLGRFELPGGEIGAALGYQHRNDSLSRVPPANVISGDQFIGDRVLPFSRNRRVNSWFGELAVPVLPNLEFSAAVRDESYSTGQGEFIHKLGLVYQPLDWVGLRATVGEAFVAPSLTQLSNPQQCGLTNVDDPFGPFAAFTASCSQGNPDLLSETSDSISLGVDLSLFDGLDLSLTWSEIDFTDRIVSTTTADILRTDFIRFKQATGFQPPSGNEFPIGLGDYPSVDLLQQWVNNPLSDKRIIRNARDIQTVDRMLQSDSNASEMRVRTLDFSADYSRSFGNIGTFSVNLMGTYIDEWRFDLGPLDPVRYAEGKQNNNYGAVPASPELRANTRFTWSNGPHLISTTVRYTSSVDYDANNYAFQNVFPFSNWREVDTIQAWTQQDIFYSYRNIQVPRVGGESSLTIGLRNMWDREAQKVGMTGGMVGEMQSPLGRVIYGRISYEL